MREKIVFVENSGLGNLVLSTPMLKAIKMIKPNCELIVLTWNRSASVLEGANFIDLLLTIEQGNIILNNFQPYIDHLLISPVGALTQIVDVLKPYSKKCYQINPGSFWGKHEAEYKLDLAKQMGYKGSLLPCEVPIFDYNIENANAVIQTNDLINKPFFCINASYLKNDHWNIKHWGNYQYTRLLIELNKLYPDHYFVFVGAKEDKGDADRINANMNPTRNMDKNDCFTEEFLGDVPEELVKNVCGAFNDIKDSAAFISKSVLLIGNDGGLQHIAAALNVSSVTIFTFTNPIKNRPLSSKSYLIMNPCNERIKCQHLPWNNFKRNDYGEYRDSSCYKNGCLNVPVDKVITKVKEIYKREIYNGIRYGGNITQTSKPAN